MIQPQRTPRADSLRNRAKILDAARLRIAESGSDVAMTDIADAAGVAVGTLYNHFPTKVDLVAAVMAEYVHQVADRADELRAAVEAQGMAGGTAVTEFLQFVLDASAVNHAVKVVAQTMGSAAADDAPDETRAARALAFLLGAAQQQGTVREAVTVEDVYLLVNSAPLDSPKHARDRWLELVSRGIRAD
ncbi:MULTISPECIES: TetR/AcrR family transcriptional regulator [unclassified Nocardioides]|uniref:TetR/AcrR family transcriptional regulator n=1 Tax=unclassified Nocardioides TaxID=2615069 RepID=UPI00361239BE